MLIKIPLIFTVYLAILLYFCVFDFGWFILLLFMAVLFLALWRKYVILLPILLVLFIFYSFVKSENEHHLLQNPATISCIQPIPDTIQVNGNLLSFQGKESGQTYQVYDSLSTLQEKIFFQKLSQNCTINFTGRFSVPEQQRNFNGFNDQKYLATQNIYRQVNIQKIHSVQKNKHFDLHLLRRKAIVWVQMHFPTPMSNYMTGLLFGYLSKDFNEMSDLYSSLGIIHLFALSGMQVNFFIDWLRKILLRIGIRRDRIMLIQLPFSVFYAFLTGSSSSVLRALIQKNIRLTGLDNFSVTFFILLILSPKFLLTAGGQLTLLYAFVLSMLTGKFQHLNQVKRLLIESTLLSLMVLPLLILDFHIFQPFSILLTVAFGFLFDCFLLPLLLLTFLLSLVGIFLPINFLFQDLEKIIHVIHLPLHYPFVLGTPNAIQLIFLFVSTGLLIDFYFKKRGRWLLLLAISVLIFFCKNPLYPSITIVDIGQGDSIFLQDCQKQENILIDTGGRLNIPMKTWQMAKTQTNAEKTLIPYLESRGVGKIDALILTHTDADHVGDFLNLADKIKIKQIWVSPGELRDSVFLAKLKQADIPIHLSQVGDNIPIFDSELKILSNGYTGKGDNNDSIVSYGNFYGKKFLFTGDLEQDGEQQLLKNFPSLKVDVLKVGHHGSKTSSNPSFIHAIKPQLALISVGKKNRYGHPNQETLDTFQKEHVKIIRTDQHGAIKLIHKQEKWQIETVR